SISTIFTLDIYKLYIKPDASEAHLVKVGKITVWVAMLIATLVAPQLRVLEQAFQFIQEYSSFITPVVFAIFIFGMYWKRTTSLDAMTAALLNITMSVIIKIWFEHIPFHNRMGYIFLILVMVVLALSLLNPKNKNNHKAL